MKAKYPPREGYKSGALGYASDMVHIAVNHDDAEGFMKYLEECGGLEVEVFIAGSLCNYAAIHGASECLKALFAAGVKSNHDLDYWLKVAENPPYGPRAANQLNRAAA